MNGDPPVAQKVQVLLIDDIDGGQAEQTVSFSLDGSVYEIDLNNANAARLREALAPFVTAARKAPVRRSAALAAKSLPHKDRTARIRAWAKAHGKQVNDRGRLPQEIIDAYHAAQG